MKIYLFCSAGMSTSLLVTKMKKAAEEQGMTDLEIEAFAEAKAAEKGVEADVVLLGPQIKFREKSIKEKLPTKPVMVINMQDYGLVNGPKVLESALELYKEFNQ
ncbi:MAG: PTS sugar transporter subunit IIB [Anaerorhabdus sp.]